MTRLGFAVSLRTGFPPMKLESAGSWKPFSPHGRCRTAKRSLIVSAAAARHRLCKRRTSSRLSSLAPLHCRQQHWDICFAASSKRAGPIWRSRSWRSSGSRSSVLRPQREHYCATASTGAVAPSGHDHSGSVGHSPERVALEYRHRATARQGNHAGHLELGHLPADRFDGEAQHIGDCASGKRKIEGYRSIGAGAIAPDPLESLEQKVCDPLAGTLTTE
ncbi:hypothetical protein sphantq_00623 [Sphingobium sp. AntQ-1]|nr:hypothetical protein sphantq_00623 [Sphingobium sp. AntQ-1]